MDALLASRRDLFQQVAPPAVDQQQSKSKVMVSHDEDPFPLWEKDLDAYIMFQMESWPIEEIEKVIIWLG
jgi:hypothetical protein